MYYDNVDAAYLYTLFDHQTGYPRCAGLYVDDKIVTYDLYRPGAGKKIRIINDAISEIRDTIISLNDNGYKIVTSNFKKNLLTYKLPIDSRLYNVYDLHIDVQSDPIRSTNSQSKDNYLLRKILERLSDKPCYEYQKLISNAAVVYQDLENRGLYVNDELFKPEWSMLTFSGRTKTSGFNIQGFNEDQHVRAIDSPNNNVLLHFDWISADIRIASLLSGDDLLIDSFKVSDPYTEMLNFFRNNNIRDIDREECKRYLLRSINSMDITSDAFIIYKKLGRWIKYCYEATMNRDGVLETILNRKFKVSKAKNSLAVLNGVMQGSVAHATHAVVRKIWERIGSYLLAEIHDSFILSVPNDSSIIRSTIDTVVPIMMYPFDGLLSDNPVFPIRVSVGKKWKKWQLFEIYRESGVERVKKRE